MWGIGGKQESNEDQLSQTNWKKKVSKVLKHHKDRLRNNHTYQIKFSTHRNNQVFIQYFEDALSRMNTKGVFETLDDSRLRDSYRDVELFFHLNVYGDNEQQKDSIDFSLKKFDQHYEINVYIHDFGHAYLVETHPLPVSRIFSIGRANLSSRGPKGGRAPDVVIGKRKHQDKYPTRSDMDESLLTILSEMAFTMERASISGDGYGNADETWYCQARRQGQYMTVENGTDDGQFPLDYPYKRAPYYLGNYINTFADPSSTVDRILFEVVRKDQTGEEK